LTWTASHADDHEAAEFKSELQEDNSDMSSVIRELHLPHTDDSSVEIGKDSESSAGVVVTGIDGMKETLLSLDAVSSDPITAVSVMTSADDGTAVAETGMIDSDKFRAAFSCDNDELDTGESAQAGSGKLVTAKSAEFDEAFVTSSNSLDATEADGCSEALAAAVDTIPPSETFPTDMPNAVNSVESVNKDEVNLSEKQLPVDMLESPVETADDVWQDSTAVGSSSGKYASHTLNSVISQLKLAIASALSGCTTIFISYWLLVMSAYQRA